MREEQEHSRTASLHEFHLDSKYDILRNLRPHRDILTRLSFFKEKIIRINITKDQSLATDTREDVLYPEERPTFSPSKRQVRRAGPLITRMLDSSSTLPTSHRDTLHIMT